MPDIHETSYNAWMGQKKTALRRPTLDCGCPNGGVVSFHLWCDRLACQEHADAAHDCGEFKGSKSGIEEEAVEPEAVVEARRRDPLCTCPPDMPANSYMPGCPPCEAFVLRINPPICRGCRAAMAHPASGRSHVPRMPRGACLPQPAHQ